MSETLSEMASKLGGGRELSVSQKEKLIYCVVWFNPLLSLLNCLSME